MFVMKASSSKEKILIIGENLSDAIASLTSFLMLPGSPSHYLQTWSFASGNLPSRCSSNCKLTNGKGFTHSIRKINVYGPSSSFILWPSFPPLLGYTHLQMDTVRMNWRLRTSRILLNCILPFSNL